MITSVCFRHIARAHTGTSDLLPDYMHVLCFLPEHSTSSYLPVDAIVHTGATSSYVPKRRHCTYRGDGCSSDHRYWSRDYGRFLHFRWPASRLGTWCRWLQYKQTVMWLKQATDYMPVCAGIHDNRGRCRYEIVNKPLRFEFLLHWLLILKLGFYCTNLWFWSWVFRSHCLESKNLVLASYA